MTQRNPLWELVEEALDARVDPFTGRRPNQADVARLSGVSGQSISMYKKGRRPEPPHLAALADALKIPYSRAVAAVLEGWGYLPEGATIKVSTSGTGENLTDFVDGLLAEAAGEAESSAG